MNKEIINGLKQRAEEMLKNDYSRKIGDEEIYTIICEWEKTFNLYIKEKEKNAKLKSRKYILNAETQEIKEIPISDNYICKDKIREKIKELENKQEINRKKLAKAIDVFNFKSIDNISANMTIIMCVEDILEELLESEE